MDSDVVSIIGAAVIDDHTVVTRFGSGPEDRVEAVDLQFAHREPVMQADVEQGQVHRGKLAPAIAVQRAIDGAGCILDADEVMTIGPGPLRLPRREAQS